MLMVADTKIEASENGISQMSLHFIEPFPL